MEKQHGETYWVTPSTLSPYSLLCIQVLKTIKNKWWWAQAGAFTSKEKLSEARPRLLGVVWTLEKLMEQNGLY